jgi:hypothetical protein
MLGFLLPKSYCPQVSLDAHRTSCAIVYTQGKAMCQLVHILRWALGLHFLAPKRACRKNHCSVAINGCCALNLLCLNSLSKILFAFSKSMKDLSRTYFFYDWMVMLTVVCPKKWLWLKDCGWVSLVFFSFLKILFFSSIWVHCHCLQTHQKRASDPITDGCEPPCGC